MLRMRLQSFEEMSRTGRARACQTRFSRDSAALGGHSLITQHLAELTARKMVYAANWWERLGQAHGAVTDSMRCM